MAVDQSTGGAVNFNGHYGSRAAACCAWWSLCCAKAGGGRLAACGLVQVVIGAPTVIAADMLRSFGIKLVVRGSGERNKRQGGWKGQQVRARCDVAV